MVGTLACINLCMRFYKLMLLKKNLFFQTHKNYFAVIFGRREALFVLLVFRKKKVIEN